MFITYYSSPESWVINTFLGIVNLKRKTASQIMDTLKAFFEAKAKIIQWVVKKTDFKEEFGQTYYTFILIIVITN